jgi:hypothetical protein
MTAIEGRAYEQALAERGHRCRRDYVYELADEMGVDRQIAAVLADTLGQGEDFDGLVNMLEDFSNGGW